MVEKIEFEALKGKILSGDLEIIGLINYIGIGLLVALFANAFFTINYRPMPLLKIISLIILFSIAVSLLFFNVKRYLGYQQKMKGIKIDIYYPNSRLKFDLTFIITLLFYSFVILVINNISLLVINSISNILKIIFKLLVIKFSVSLLLLSFIASAATILPYIFFFYYLRSSEKRYKPSPA